MARLPTGRAFWIHSRRRPIRAPVEPSGALLHDRGEIEGAMSGLGQGGDGSLNAFTDVYRDQITKLAARYRVMPRSPC